MKIISILIYLIFSISLISCSSEKNISYKIAELNGKYAAHSIESSTNHNYNFMALLNRQLIKDTLNYEAIANYKFEIQIIDNSHLRINKINGEDKIFNSKIYRYKRKSEFIILKNKNVKTILIPYLIGALDVCKLGLKNDENGNLEVIINEHRSGGLFLIPMGWTEQISNEKYRKIN
jgi:hypothetical protein